jgi:hypothetical protein
MGAVDSRSVAAVLKEIGENIVSQLIRIMFKEIAEECGNAASDLPSLRDAVATSPQDHEQDIIHYLESAPNYSAMGKVVRDVLDPDSGTILYPAVNTDGLYLWPLELAHYVRKYHVRLPQHFLDRMASLNWKPPPQTAIDYKKLYAGLAM